MLKRTSFKRCRCLLICLAAFCFLVDVLLVTSKRLQPYGFLFSEPKEPPQTSEVSDTWANSNAFASEYIDVFPCLESSSGLNDSKTAQFQHGSWTFANSNMPPARIWMYWENLSGKVMPGRVELSYESMVRHGHPMKVILLDIDTVEDYVTTMHPEWKHITPLAMKADYIRFKVLYELGGLWFDSDTIGTGDIYHEFFLRLRNADFVGYSEHEAVAYSYPDYSISAMAVRAGSPSLIESIKGFETRLNTGKTSITWGGVHSSCS